MRKLLNPSMQLRDKRKQISNRTAENYFYRRSSKSRRSKSKNRVKLKMFPRRERKRPTVNNKYANAHTHTRRHTHTHAYTHAADGFFAIANNIIKNRRTFFSSLDNGAVCWTATERPTTIYNWNKTNKKIACQ